jgi:hypothetical protein
MAAGRKYIASGKDVAAGAPPRPNGGGGQ